MGTMWSLLSQQTLINVIMINVNSALSHQDHPPNTLIIIDHDRKTHIDHQHIDHDRNTHIDPDQCELTLLSQQVHIDHDQCELAPKSMIIVRNVKRSKLVLISRSR